jgi:hypothetical protein
MNSSKFKNQTTRKSFFWRENNCYDNLFSIDNYRLQRRLLTLISLPTPTAIRKTPASFITRASPSVARTYFARPSVRMTPIRKTPRLAEIRRN